MRNDEIGMITDKVKNISNKLDVYSKIISKIENNLKIINEKNKNAYISSNSNIIKKNNDLIIDGLHVNSKNIKSYNTYILRKIKAYNDVTA